MRDAVAIGLDEWKAVEADYPVLLVELLARLGRVRSHIDKAFDPVYTEHGLTAPEFYVLANLARQTGHRVGQTRLAYLTSLTPGTVSVRISAMADKGLVSVERAATGRGRDIVATTEGTRRFEACQKALRLHQERLFSALSSPQRSQLAALLRRLGLDYEIETSGGSRNYPPLGIELAPAHLARRTRASVGLPEVSGLLITQLGSTSPADLHVGDLITHADGQPVLSLLDLPPLEPIKTLAVLRGTDPLTINLAGDRPSSDEPGTGRRTEGAAHRNPR